MGLHVNLLLSIKFLFISSSSENLNMFLPRLFFWCKNFVVERELLEKGQVCMCRGVVVFGFGNGYGG